VKRVLGLLLYTSYKLKYHYFIQISLRNWLWVLVFAPLVAAFIRRMAWYSAISSSVLGTLLLLGIDWSRRQGYAIFEPAPLGANAEAGPPIQADEQVPCRAFGLFAVGGDRRTMVNEPARISYVSTREHIVMVYLRQTRFLLLTRSEGAEVGCWYAFFTPQDVQRVETGHIQCGIRTQPGLAVRYRSAEEGEDTETRNQVDTVYLAFDDTGTLQRVLDDLRLDVAPGAFGEAAASVGG